VSEVLANNDDWQPRKKMMATFALAAVAVMCLVLVVFAVWQKVAFVFLGQLIVTVLLALSLRAYSPQLLGKAFWCTFSFFIVLTLALIFGTMSTRYQEEEFIPTALGPRAFGFGENVANASGLPIDFQPPLGAHPGYSICNTCWGNRNMTAEHQLNVLDLAMLAKASYASDGQRALALESMFNGTLLDNWQMIESAPDAVVGSWLAVDFPRQKNSGTRYPRHIYARRDVCRPSDLQCGCGFANVQRRQSSSKTRTIGHHPIPSRT